MGSPPYPVIARLYAIAAERWAELDAAYPGVDLLRLPCHRFLNYVWTWCLLRIPGDKMEQFVHEMNAPLPGSRGSGKPQASQAQLDEEGQDFLNFMQLHTQNVGGG